MKRITTFALMTTLALLQAFAQTKEFRPYKDWKTVAFCKYNSYHPSQYASIDNNWEMLLALRTPMNQKELEATGVKFTVSQLALLNIGGLIENENKKWHTVMPIFDESQTEAIRKLSKDLAKEAYSKTETDWTVLTKWLKEHNLGDNAYSLVFSYVLDHKIWKKKLPSYNDIRENATWSGAYWALYNARPGISCGTNGYGNRFFQTWTDSLCWWIGNKTISKFIWEYEKNGKIADKELLSEVISWGLADKDGNVLVPVIAENGDFDNIAELIVSKIASVMYSQSSSFMNEYGIENEKLAVTILYHEVMWDLMDILESNGIITEPAILKGDPSVRKQDFAKIVYLLDELN